MEIARVEGIPPDLARRIAPHFAEQEWPIVADDLRAGRAECFDINQGESVCITRFEIVGDHKELVVVLYEGRALIEFARVLYRAALDNGATSVRWHTRRRGMARMLAEFGAVETETIYTVELENGRTAKTN